VYDFTVRPDDGDPYSVTAESRDVLAWEKSGKGRVYSNLVRGTVHMADVYVLAHLASRREGLFTGTLSEFEKTATVELGSKDEEDEAADPTRTAP
jgi:hypothetical protein